MTKSNSCCATRTITDGQSKSCGNIVWTKNAQCCFRRLMACWTLHAWPNGYCVTVCRSGCCCNCTSCCGTARPDIDDEKCRGAFIGRPGFGNGAGDGAGAGFYLLCV